MSAEEIAQEKPTLAEVAERVSAEMMWRLRLEGWGGSPPRGELRGEHSGRAPASADSGAGTSL